MAFDAREAKSLESTMRALDRLPANAPASALLDALHDLAPAVAGTLNIIRPAEPDRLVSHAINLPPEVFETWQRTPREVLAATLAPVLAAPEGGLSRDPEAIKGRLREQFTVLRKMDDMGLGEGAGYKILRRPAPWRGSEHVMLALIAERGRPLPRRTEALLAAIVPSVREAVLRLQLPLVARAPILGQIVAEQSLGYVAVSKSGAVLESNRIAHRLAQRYGRAAGVEGRRRVLVDFAARARVEARFGRTWYVPLAEPQSVLVVDAHALARQAHGLREDVLLVVMREIVAPLVDAREPAALGRLTERQREIAILAARSGLSHKQIADRLGLAPATVNKHVENIHHALGVHSRAELAALLRQIE